MKECHGSEVDWDDMERRIGEMRGPFQAAMSEMRRGFSVIEDGIALQNLLAENLVNYTLKISNLPGRVDTPDGPVDMSRALRANILQYLADFVTEEQRRAGVI